MMECLLQLSTKHTNKSVQLLNRRQEDESGCEEGSARAQDEPKIALLE